VEEFIYIAFFAFIFIILPILKKVAESVAEKKKREQRGGKPRMDLHQKERGPAGEVLDELEDFFRRARFGSDEAAEPKVEKAARKPRIYAKFDLEYQERKAQIEERKRRREEERRRKRLKSAGKPAVAPVERKREDPAKSVFQPATAGEPEIVTIVEEPKRKDMVELSTLKAQLAPEVEKVESFAEVLGEMPEMAQAMVLCEIFSAPKSLQEF